MNKEIFIDKIIKKFPRHFIRIISLRFTFTKEQILKYGDILSWDQYGLPNNENIVWDKELITRFGDKFFKYPRELFAKQCYNEHYRHLGRERVEDISIFYQDLPSHELNLTKDTKEKGIKLI